MVKLTEKRLKKFNPPVPGSNSKFWTSTRNIHYLYNGIVIFIGLFIIIKGIKMIGKGITGDIEWIVKAFGNESNLKNASPGVLLTVLGLLFIVVAKDNVEFKRKKK